MLNAANISIEQAIRLIHKAGGRAVWAHPLFVSRNFEKRKLEKEWMHRVAQDAKLFCTSGSDFHGSKGRDFMGMKVLHEDWIG